MRLPRVQFTVWGVMVLVAAAAIALTIYKTLHDWYVKQALVEWGGGHLLGMGIVVSSVACLAVALARWNISPDGNGARSHLARLVRSVISAVILIGVPDTVFLAIYWWSCGGRWYGWTPWVDGYPLLNSDGVCVAAVVSLGVAYMLRIVSRSGFGKEKTSHDEWDG
jgi:hypothetical protein